MIDVIVVAAVGGGGGGGGGAVAVVAVAVAVAVAVVAVAVAVAVAVVVVAVAVIVVAAVVVSEGGGLWWDFGAFVVLHYVRYLRRHWSFQWLQDIVFVEEKKRWDSGSSHVVQACVP